MHSKICCLDCHSGKRYEIGNKENFIVSCGLNAFRNMLSSKCICIASCFFYLFMK
ncbi:hypothetical protein ACS0TY_023392 [Phlomoides rotata]